MFTASGVDKLKQRIQQLQQEKVALKAHFRDLKKGQKALQRDVHAQQELIEAEHKVRSSTLMQTEIRIVVIEVLFCISCSVARTCKCSNSVK